MCSLAPRPRPSSPLPRPRLRLALDHLEDRMAPALFAMAPGSPFSSGGATPPPRCRSATLTATAASTWSRPTATAAAPCQSCWGTGRAGSPPPPAPRSPRGGSPPRRGRRGLQRGRPARPGHGAGHRFGLPGQRVGGIHGRPRLPVFKLCTSSPPTGRYLCGHPGTCAGQ